MSRALKYCLIMSYKPPNQRTLFWPGEPALWLSPHWPVALAA